jgi:hypothetical protein
MTEPNPDAWQDYTTGRERVRMVVETLDEPASVTQIAEEADVAWDTANTELERLLAESHIREITDEGQTRYEPNPVQFLFGEILTLINEHDRAELESQLVEHQSRLESLQEEHNVETAEAFRRTLTDDDLTADEMREIRHTASTWESLETERRLVSHALELYNDVSSLAAADGIERLVPS